MKVLVALDHSPVSLRAAREAAWLFRDAEHLVVNVTQVPVPWVAAGEFGMVYPATPQELNPAEGGRLRGAGVSRFVGRAERAGCDVNDG